LIVLPKKKKKIVTKLRNAAANNITPTWLLINMHIYALNAQHRRKKHSMLMHLSKWIKNPFNHFKNPKKCLKNKKSQGSLENMCNSTIILHLLI
jgi:hypothetical protein